ncbi:DEAD/DEAH box helicase [Fusobacterium perfoetens]|uniref:helicase C-terminal domain-containing protein n=1 Tax=Fusobacterium perfoetens TaxID=852 RepID=UPI001F3C0152|nr:helicase C-terminal domain-containing protein [Fusobacterium perfoetens]MCF2625782.1 DEAD/DEAH box helicase [Fusobacterium perfoetens]
MNIEEKISLEAREKMAFEIEESGGNEVFFRGILDENKIVADVEVLAKGNRYSVPAILKRMKKNEIIIHNHPSGYLYPSDADVEIASIFADRMDGGSYIIDNSAENVYVITEAYFDENKKIDIKPYFERNGLLSQCFKEFEYRDEQLHMAEHIEKGLNDEKKVVVEAGTGTGKTLAYLIPSIQWAVENGKKVIISTNTINLQEQLLNKDIPIVKKIMQKDFKYLLVKGRGNFLCNRKHANLLSMKPADLEEFSQDQKKQFEALINWGKETRIGDKSELYFEVDYTVWEYFQSETDICAGSRCPYKSECFFLKSREEKKKADILIANHHIFFSDLAIRKEIGFNTDYSILPEYGLVVFDEAHNIQKVARDYFSYEVSKYGFTKAMNQIHNVSNNKKHKGQLEILLQYLKKRNYEDKEVVEKLLENDVRINHNNLFKAGRDYFDRLIEIFSKGQVGSISFRIKKDEIMASSFYSMLNDVKENFILEFNTYLRTARKIITSLKDTEDNDGIINDFSKYIERLETFFENFKFINNLDDEEFIYWVEVNNKKSNSKLVATPLNIDGELSENLYSNLKQLIFTSATIAVENNFDYFKKSIGLEEETYDKIIASPFDYDRQMKVYIPSGLPDPNDRNFLDEIEPLLKKMILKTKGRTFVLFTSYKSLNYMYYMLREELEENGINFFIQGMYPRTKLVEMFKNSDSPVLFGTDSFWEGVDVKGEKLVSVIIVKLPFKVPSDPVTEAIIETYELQGKNPFIEYQIPESVIKFKQGIGRLIRSKEDRGIITILDNRIVTKRYGKYFLDSIPTKNIQRIDQSEITG